MLHEGVAPQRILWWLGGGVEPPTLRYSVGGTSVTVLHGEPVCTASNFCRLLSLFVVTPHCKNSNDSVRFQHLVDETMLNIDAP